MKDLLRRPRLAPTALFALALGTVLAVPHPALAATEIGADYTGAVDRLIVQSGVEATDLSLSFHSVPPEDAPFANDPVVRFESSSGELFELGLQSSCSRAATPPNPRVLYCKVPDGIGADGIIERIDADLGAGADELSAQSGVPKLVANGEGGSDSISGGDAPDQLAGGDGDDTLTGSGGNDILDGEGDDDVLRGLAGDDTFRAEPGSDTFSGGENPADRDTLSYASGAAVTVSLDGVANDGPTGASEGDNAGDDIEVVVGTTAGDVLTGGTGGEELRGGAGADVLSGSGGDDLLLGGDGSDSHIGGAGVDAASYGDRTSGEPVSASLAAGGGGQLGTAEDDSFGGGVENLIGGEGSDLLLGNSVANELSGGGGEDELNGLGGPDLLDGGAGTGVADTLEGSSGVDTVTYAARTVPIRIVLHGGPSGGQGGGEGDAISTVENAIGGSAADQIEGGAGVNHLEGGLGDDSLAGGGGDDVLQGDGDDDTLFGEQGDDELVGDNGLATQLGGDTLFGGPDDDLLIGGSAGFDGPQTTPNFLHGGEGDDTLDGSSGQGGIDVASYEFAALPVEVDLAAGLATGEGTDTLVEIEHATGSPFDDRLLGDGFANRLEGRGGGDTLHGLSGSDVLAGGAGEDALDGGEDADAFDGGAGNDSLNSADGVAETLLCGEGTDTVVADSVDLLDASCERVPDPGPAPTGPRPPQPRPPTEQQPSAEGTPTDGDAPETTIAKAPTKTRVRHLIRIVFVADESGSRFECSLDRRPFKPCSSPLKRRLPAGRHTFRVRATDPAGNTDPTPATARIKVTNPAPSDRA